MNIRVKDYVYYYTQMVAQRVDRWTCNQQLWVQILLGAKAA